MKLYGIPNCDTVKRARNFLEKKEIVFQFIDFKKTPPTQEDLLRWSEAFGDLPVNKSGLTYKKHKEQFEGLTPDEKIDFLIKYSSMIKRPIVEKNGKVLAFGFKEDDYKALAK